MRTRFKIQDKCGFAAGDVNLFRYVHNDPTNFTDPSGLEEKNVCSVKAITLVREVKELPKELQDKRPTYGKLWEEDEEVQPDNIGPFKDPNEKGNAAYVLWVVLQGENLHDCEVKRVFHTTSRFGDTTRKYPKESKGFISKQKITSGQPDGPPNYNIKNTGTILILADGPGFAKLKPVKQYPASYETNFYLVARSKKDGKIKAQIWYDVIIKTEAPGKVSVMKAYVVDKTPK
jgi:hypothetical protein